MCNETHFLVALKDLSPRPKKGVVLINMKLSVEVINIQHGSLKKSIKPPGGEGGLRPVPEQYMQRQWMILKSI